MIAKSVLRRITYLSQLFDPEPTFKGLKFVKLLCARNFAVDVVTGFPNYPGGKVYKGYKIKLLQREFLDSIPVSRLAIFPSHDRSAVQRILCYFSFMLTSFLYLVFRARKPDLIYVFYPSLTAGISAICAKFFRRIKVVVEIQDMWPDSLGATGMMNSSLLYRATSVACRVLYKFSDHITVSSPGFKSLLVSRGVSADKISVIYNWADEVDSNGANVEPGNFNDIQGFRVLFAGNMGAAQGLDTILDAAAFLKARSVRVSIVLMGEGVELPRLRERALKEGLTNVVFLPRVPLEQVQDYLMSADCLLVHLKCDPLFKITIPSKTQAYLYAGRPIVMAVEGDAAELIAEARAGIACPSEQPQQLAGVIEEMVNTSKVELAEMGKNGRTYYDNKLSCSVGLDRLSRLLNGVIGNDRCVSGDGENLQ